MIGLTAVVFFGLGYAVAVIVKMRAKEAGRADV